MWAAIRKDFLADSLNDAFSQASPCISAAGLIPKQSFEKKISLPDETVMDCTPSGECNPTRDCTPTRVCTSTQDCSPTRNCTPTADCSQPNDQRDCSACLVHNPFGGCTIRGNDPICEAAKAGQNAAYAAAKATCETQKTAAKTDCERLKAQDKDLCEADKSAKRLDCERLKTQERAQCETEKTGERLACEGVKTGKKLACGTAKEGLKRLSRTGKFANLEGSIGGPAELKLCFGAVDLARDLTNLSFTLNVAGSADLATHIKFVPLDIIGHLSCQIPWTEDRTLRAEVPTQSLPIKIGLSRTSEGGRQTFKAHLDEVTVKLHVQPSPTALILQSTNFNLSCMPLAGLLNAVSLSLAPFVPELMGDFEHKQKSIDLSFQPQFPKLSVSTREVKIEIVETDRAIILKGSL